MLKNFVFTLDILPPIIPSGDYRIDIEWFMDQNASVRYVLVQNFVSIRALTLVDSNMG
jgi:hypothetical protein